MADPEENPKPTPEESASTPAEQEPETPAKAETVAATEPPAEPVKEEAAPEPTEAPAATAAKEEPVKEAKPAKKKAAPKAKGKGDSKELSLEGDDVPKPKIFKAKGSKNVHSGIAHVLATFNNTIVTITDLNGAVIGWSSAGKIGFKGSRKSTAYAAQTVAQDACRQAMAHGLKEVEVRVKGPGSGRESAVRAMQAIGLEINVIRDVTPVPHNGCRPPKQRRV